MAESIKLKDILDRILRHTARRPPTSTSRDVSDQALSNFYCVLRCALRRAANGMHNIIYVESSLL